MRKTNFLKLAALVMMLFVSITAMAADYEAVVEGDVLKINVTKNTGADVSDYYVNVPNAISKIVITGTRPKSIALYKENSKLATTLEYDCTSFPAINKTQGTDYLKNINTVILTGNVTGDIESYAFRELTKLNSLVITKTDKVATFKANGSNFFATSHKGTVDVRVPYNLYRSYQSDAEWTKWFNPTQFSTDIELTDNTPFTDVAPFKVHSITYTRNFTTTDWQALYLPFELNTAELSGITIAKLDDVNQSAKSTYLNFSDFEGTTEANFPYLVKPAETGSYTFSKESSIPFEVKGVQKKESSETWCASTTKEFHLLGIYEKTPISGDYMYALNKGTLYRAEGTVNLNPYRWYLEVRDKATGNGSSSSAATIRIVTSDEEETSLSSILDTTDELCIVYSVNGQAVANVNSIDEFTKSAAPAGLYIINGKKIQKF